MKYLKNVIFLLAGLALVPVTAISQVGINSGGSQPDSSAILDVSSTSKGFLPPRMTFLQRNSIHNPVDGLMVYCTDCNADGSGVLCMYQDGKWQNSLWGCPSPSVPSAQVHISLQTAIVWKWSSMPIAAGYRENFKDDYSTSIDIGNVTSFEETGLSCWTSYTRYIWAYNDCGHSASVPLTQSTKMVPFSPAPDAGTQVPSAGQVIWNWNSVAGAVGYRWNTVNIFETAMEMGTLTSLTESNLSCGTDFTRYVWAYDICGYSPVTILSATTPDTVSSPTAAANTYSDSLITWRWRAVPDATGYKWSEFNDYALATDIGTDTSLIQSGMFGGDTYTKYIWAYNSTCAVSVPTILSQYVPISIGILYQGGYVFYIDGTGKHGMIVSPDAFTPASWGCAGTFISGTSTDFGTGQANTITILNGCSETTIAARACDNYDNGYTDWFLPSRDELYQVYVTRNVNGGFNGDFWSSSETNTNFSVIVGADGNFQDYFYKSSSQPFRCVRSF